VTVSEDSANALIVRPEVARRQMEADATVVAPVPGPSGGTGPQPPVGLRDDDGAKPPIIEPARPTAPRRYHGTVTLDPIFAGRDAGRIAEEVIAHLASLVGANVRVTLEIEADIPNGAPDNVVRIVTENGRALKFTSQGFERE